MNQSARRLLPAAGFVFLASVPLAAVADSQLERFEALSEQANEVMMEVMVRQYVAMGIEETAIREAVPDSAWDAEYREAGQCMLDRYTGLIGESGIDDMLDQMGAMIESIDPETATMESMSALGEMSAMEGISTEQQMEITNECGLVELGMRRMRDSGFMEILQTQMRQGIERP